MYYYLEKQFRNMKHYEYYLDELLDYLVYIVGMECEEAMGVIKNNERTNYYYQEYLYYVEKNCKGVLEDEQLIVAFPDNKIRIFMDLERCAYELDLPKLVVAVALNNGTEFGEGLYVAYLDKVKQSRLATKRLFRVVLSDEEFE